MSEGLYRGVLVGSDGSATAAATVAAASGLAAVLDVPLAVVTAWYRDLDDPPPPSEEASYPGGTASGHEARWAGRTAADAAGIARRAGVSEVEQVTPIGNAAEALIELAESRVDTLTVVGTVGLTERAERLLGNVPHQLTHHGTGDVFLVAATGRDTDRWQRVALATDGSDTAARACHRGSALAQALGARSTLLTVAKSRATGEAVLERARDRLGAGVDGIDQQVVPGGGDTARVLGEAARDHDLLVIGNKGMSGPSRLLGSVSNRVTHDVPTDLLLVNTVKRDEVST